MFKKLLFTFFTLMTLLFSETYQVEIRKNMWNLVGVNGYHVPSQNTIPVVGWTQIKETADSDHNETWDMIDETTTNSVLTSDSGDRIYSTLGMFIEKESNLELSEVIINYSKKDKNTSKIFLSMYVSSEGYGRKADLKITYQSDYEDEVFYLTLNGSSTQSYEGKFSSLYTRENPLFLSKYKSSSTDAIKEIEKTIDMDLSDNNLSNLSNLDINENALNYGETGGRQRLGTDENVSVYRWQNNLNGQKWNIYHSSNSGALNEFDSFNAGESYWVKVETNTDKPIGFLLGTGDINSTTYTEEVASATEGWNLLSFNESYIRYISSGVFIDNSEYNGSGLLIRDNYHNSTILVPSYLTGSDVNVSAFINNSVAIGDANGSASWNLRAFPAINRLGTNGVIIISDEDFEVNASSAAYTTMSLAGQQLSDPDSVNETINNVADPQTLYKTRIDEFVLATRLNEEIYGKNLANQQTSILYTIPSTSASATIDLSTATSYSDVLTLVGNSIGEAYLIDQNLSGNYNVMLHASANKFYLRDSTITKVYDFNDSHSSADFVLSYGSSSSTITSNGSLTDTINQINAVSGTTGVGAYEINADEKRILLMGKNEKTLFIKEKDELEQFFPVDLLYESNKSKYGAISDVYYGTELARSEIREINITQLSSTWDIEDNTILSGNTLTGVPNTPVSARKNLGYTPVWAPDFPIEGPLSELKDLNGSGSRVNYIISGVTRENSTIYWRQADTTMDTTKWKTEEERFNLFKIHKDRGYWVYTDYSPSVTQNPIVVNDPVFTNTIVRNFNNYFDGNISSNNTSPVVNNITTDISLTISGIDATYSEAGEYSENVQMHIDGEVIPLIKNGSTLNYIGEVADDEISALKERITPSLKTGIKVIVTDGLGNKQEEIVTFDNIKPIAPEYSFEDNNSDSGQGYFGGLRFIIDDNITLAIYDGNLSDDVSNDSLLIKTAETVTIPNGSNTTIHHVNPLDGNYISFGTAAKPYYDLRLIQYTSNDIWSDMRRVYYAPIYKSSHIIESDESNTSSDANDTLPIAFSSDGQTPVQYNEGSGWTDSGIELSSYDGNESDTNTTLSLSYEPIVGAKFNAGLASEVYFDDNTSISGFVGRIRYATNYEGEVFYVYSSDNNQLYYQVFPTGGPGLLNSSTDPLELIPIDSNQSFSKPIL